MFQGYHIVENDDDDSDDDLFGRRGWTWQQASEIRIPKLEPDEAREKGKKAFQDGKYDKAIKYWQGPAHKRSSHSSSQVV